MTAYRQTASPELAPIGPGDSGRPVAKRSVYFKALGFLETPIYRRNDLGQSSRLEGPAIVEEEDSTVLLHPGQGLTLTDHGLLIVTGQPEDYRRSGL